MINRLILSPPPAKNILLSSGEDIETAINNAKKDINSLNSIPILVAAFDILGEPVSFSDTALHVLNGSYGEGIADYAVQSFAAPSGWSKKYRILFTATTSGSQSIKLYLNSFHIGDICTYSSSYFYNSALSNYFDNSVFGTERTYNYSSNGTNLKAQQSASGTSIIKSITFLIYFVHD